MLFVVRLSKERSQRSDTAIGVGFKQPLLRGVVLVAGVRCDLSERISSGTSVCLRDSAVPERTTRSVGLVHHRHQVAHGVLTGVVNDVLQIGVVHPQKRVEVLPTCPFAHFGLGVDLVLRELPAVAGCFLCFLEQVLQVRLLWPPRCLCGRGLSSRFITAAEQPKGRTAKPPKDAAPSFASNVKGAAATAKRVKIE